VHFRVFEVWELWDGHGYVLPLVELVLTQVAFGLLVRMALEALPTPCLASGGGWRRLDGGIHGGIHGFSHGFYMIWICLSHSLLLFLWSWSRFVHSPKPLSSPLEVTKPILEDFGVTHFFKSRFQNPNPNLLPHELTIGQIHYIFRCEPWNNWDLIGMPRLRRDWNPLSALCYQKIGPPVNLKGYESSANHWR